MQLNIEKITVQSSFWNEVNVLAKEAFPPEEYLAPSEIVKMAEQGDVDFWAITAHDEFVGFMVVKLYENLAYLFFLAISSLCRSKGYGGKAITLLQETYPDKQQVVDLEMLDDNAINKEQREKRRKFYLRNGYKETGLFLSYLGVDYEVLCMDDNFSPEQFKLMMSTFQIAGFKPKYFGKYAEN